MEIMNDIAAREFWSRVDICLKGESLKSLCDRTGLNYDSIRNRKSGLTYSLPRLETAYAIAKALNISIEYLLTGKHEVHQFPQRIDTIARKLTRISESNLETIETMIMALPDEESKKAAISG